MISWRKFECIFRIRTDLWWPAYGQDSVFLWLQFPDPRKIEAWLAWTGPARGTLIRVQMSVGLSYSHNALIQAKQNCTSPVILWSIKLVEQTLSKPPLVFSEAQTGPMNLSRLMVMKRVTPLLQVFREEVYPLSWWAC